MVYEFIQHVVGEEPIVDKIQIVEEVGNEESTALNKCTYCEDETFAEESELIEHHNLLHSHLELKLSTKKYKCPIEDCGHSSNILSSIRDHMRCHTKPVKCPYCPSVYTYPSLLQAHHLKEHSSEKYIYEIDEEAMKQTKELRDNILVLGNNGKYSKIQVRCFPGKRPANEPLNKDDAKVLALDPSVEEVTAFGPSKPVRKVLNVARKSTGNSPNRSAKNQVAKKSTTPVKRPSSSVEGYSFYGTKPVSLNDYKHVTTEANIQGNMVRVSVIGLQYILKLFPKVVVKDIKNES